MKDALLKSEFALPNGAATTYATPIDTGKITDFGHQPGNVEFLLNAPALTAAILSATTTLKFSVVHADNAALSGNTVLIENLITQTGVSTDGAAAAEKRFRIPSTAERFVAVKAVKSHSGNASALEGTLEVVA